MLLTFFLVTTSMDVDKGLVRQLPPKDNNAQTEASVVRKEHLTVYAITADGQLLRDGKPAAMSSVRRDVEQFAASMGSKHVVAIEADPNADYDTYFQLQNEVVAAYNNWRNHTAMKKYGRDYAHCSMAQRDDIKQMCPQHITEQKIEEGSAQ